MSIIDPSRCRKAQVTRRCDISSHHDLLGEDMNYVTSVPKTEKDIITKLNEIEAALKIQLGRIDDIKLALTNPVTTEELFATETKMPTGIVNVDLVHRVIETNVVGKELAEHIGRNMNEEY